MGYNRLTRGTALLGAVRLDVTGDATVADDLTVGDATTTSTLKVGSSGTVIKTIKKGTASVDFDSITNGETGSKTFTVTGAAVGDVVVVNPPTLTTGLAFAGAAVTGANTVTVYALNASAAPIDEGAATFTYLWVDLT